MGWKCALKHRLPSKHGLTECSIGAPNRKHKLHTDPYAGGERSGKHAKLDALSTEANARAQAQAQVPPPSGPSPNVLPFLNMLPHASPFTSPLDVIAHTPALSTKLSRALAPTLNPPALAFSKGLAPAQKSAHVSKGTYLD